MAPSLDQLRPASRRERMVRIARPEPAAVVHSGVRAQERVIRL